MKKMKIVKGCNILLLLFMLGFTLAGCGQEKKDGTIEDESLSAKNYQVTEEANPDIKMENQPVSSFWFPSQLLEWNPQTDRDVMYNISTVPLAPRVEKDELTAVNQTQNKEMKVVAISIMNASTSGNPSEGTNRFDANTFTYWQYIDTLVYWGGSSGEGLIVPPSPDVTNAAHRNGVPVLGTVFFPMYAHGGKMEWLNDFLKKDENGKFPIVPKLIEAAELYGFDGWFFNQETEGSEEEPLTKEHADLMIELIRAFKEQSDGKLSIMWYDSMTKDGVMDWQNALTDNNASFLMNEAKKTIADEMFLNFWWTDEEYAGQELLKASKEKAEVLGIDPYSIYAGVDVQQDGIYTPIRWDLFEAGVGKTFTSLGLYCPSWTFFSSKMMDDFERNENALWVNSKGDPSVQQEVKGTLWRGISTYAIEKTAIKEIPFITNFSTGNGYSFFIDGEKVSEGDWNNRSMTDILPTYRYIIENKGDNTLSAGLNFADAFYGGNSIKLRGKLGKASPSTIKLFSSDLLMDRDVIFTSTLKANYETIVSAVVTLEDGTVQVLAGDQRAGDEWRKIKFDAGKLNGHRIRMISLQFSVEEDAADYELLIGNVTMTKEEFQKKTSLSQVTVDETIFNDDKMYAGVRLSFMPNSEEIPRHYEIYRVNGDATRSLLGVSVNSCFFINGLPRSADSLKTELEVFPVNQDYEKGIPAKAYVEWPDNSLPTADFKASHTLIAPGQTVDFENLCTQNTTVYEWSFEGGEQTVSNEMSPSVTYGEEGTYKVTLTAINEKGEDTKTVEGLITVTAAVVDGLVNLSLNGEAEATSYVNDNEAPKFALDDLMDTKWCATGTPPHEITIDLLEEKQISEVVISHAEAGGEGPDMNTQKYVISVSGDGTAFTDVVTVKNNTAGTTQDAFQAVTARYVKLSVLKPTQGSDTAVRIYGIEVYGINK